MKRYILSFLILGAPALLFAQLDSFNLATYKLPVIKTHRLDFNLSGNNRNSVRWEKSRGNVDTKNGYNDFAGDFGAVYSFYGNSEKYQGEQSLSISASASSSDHDPVYKERSFKTNLTAHSVNRSYLTKRQFIEYDLELYSYIDNRKWGTDVFSNGNTSCNLDFSIPLYYGVGRIEQVQDARLAIYILEDMEKSGRISRIPDDEEILEFARLISQTKNKRFFDSRMKRIWEIETIDAWLQSKKLIKSTDANYFTRLYDNWMYAADPVRESGRRFSIGLIPALGASRSYTFAIPDTLISHPYHGFRSITGVIRHEGDKPINLYWQTGHLFEVTGYWRQSNTYYVNDTNRYQVKEAYLSGRVQYNLSWYPNTRTYLKLNAGIEGMYFPIIDNSDNDPQQHTNYDIYPNISMNFHYYISPQLQIDLSGNLSYSLTGSKWNTLLYPFAEYASTSQLYHSFYVKLFYSLF